MGSTVYLNSHFIPKNQTCFYQNRMTDYLERQEALNELILDKFKQQQVTMNKQYHHLLITITENQEASEQMKKGLTTLKAFIQQNLDFNHINQQTLLDVLEKLKQIMDI